MRVPECNHKVTGSGYKAVDGCEAETRTRALVHKSNWDIKNWIKSKQQKENVMCQKPSWQ